MHFPRARLNSANQRNSNTLTAVSPDAFQIDAKFARDFELADLVREDLLIPQLQADSKIGGIKELVDRLHRGGIVTDSLSFLQSILERENLQSTILGGDIALPHARSRSASKLGLALGTTAQPIDFPSGDDRCAIKMICLIAVPSHAPDLYLSLLASLARTLANPELKHGLLHADSAAEMYRLLTEPRLS
jgi:mannitol/fructose-specific phosphotransferase system IIA component (Ntr-type)